MFMQTKSATKICKISYKICVVLMYVRRVIALLFHISLHDAILVIYVISTISLVILLVLDCSNWRQRGIKFSSINLNYSHVTYLYDLF